SAPVVASIRAAWASVWVSAPSGGFLLLEDRELGVASARAADPAARVRAGSAEPQPVERHAVLRGTRDRADEQELVERQLGMVPVPARHAEFGLEIGGRQQLGGDAAPRHVR